MAISSVSDSSSRIQLKPFATALHRISDRIREMAAQSGIVYGSAPSAGEATMLDRAMAMLYEDLAPLMPYERISLSLVEDRHVKGVWLKSEAPKVILPADYDHELSGSTLEEIALSEQPSILNSLTDYLDHQSDAEDIRLLYNEGMRSRLTFPLFAEGRLFGFLFFCAVDYHAYSQGHAGLFRELANEIAALIHRILLYDRIIEAERMWQDTPTSKNNRHQKSWTGLQASPDACSVAIVDEDMGSMLSLEDVLTRQGFFVRQANSAIKLVDLLKDIPIDLLLLSEDLLIADGFSVIEFVRERFDWPNLPVIVMVDPNQPSSVRRCLEKGATDVIFKPIRPAEVAARAWMAIGSSPRIPAPMLPTIADDSLFAGRYQLLNKLGIGGQSIVFLAQDLGLGDKPLVALKVLDLPPSRTFDPRQTAIFLREAYQMARVESPHVVRLLDFGQDQGTFYMAQEYVDGMNVGELVEKHHALPEHTLLHILQDCSRALAALHEEGIVHRDIKPTNIMITDENDVKILDFGLSRGTHDQSLSDEYFRGTPFFAAPEYILGEKVLDIRLDVYSLAVTLYYAATGEYPFRDETPAGTLRQHLYSRCRPLYDVCPNITEEFSNLIVQMMAKNRDDRPYPLDILKRAITLSARFDGETAQLL